MGALRFAVCALALAGCSASAKPVDGQPASALPPAPSEVVPPDDPSPQDLPERDSSSPAPAPAGGPGVGGGARSSWCVSIQGETLPQRCPSGWPQADCAAWGHIDVQLQRRSGQGAELPEELIAWYRRELVGCFATAEPTEASLVVRVDGKPEECPADGAEVTMVGNLADGAARSCVRNVFRYRVLPAVEAPRISMVLDLTVRVTRAR